MSDSGDLILVCRLADENATMALGARVAACVRPGWIISLRGDLGSGKTTLTRGLLRALGHTGRVKSPTYTLVEPYKVSGLDLLHFDYYRFSDPREWLDAGFSDLFDGLNVCVVEWPERIGSLMPTAHLEVLIEPNGASRCASIRCANSAVCSCMTTQQC
jgi:tRNA threonylcarbamoyladenosine biosynthesis protein TsaE